MMTNRIKVSALALLAAATLARSQPSQPWGDASGDTRLFDFSGENITLRPDMVFQLVVDVAGDTVFTDMIAAGQSGGGWGIGNEAHMSVGSPADYLAGDDVVISPFNAWYAYPAYGVGFLPAVTTLVTDSGNDYWDMNFYFRWFNSDNVGTASEAGVIFNPAWRTVADTDPPTGADPVALNYGRVGSDGSQLVGDGWQSMPMVPEPGTFALFGLGLLTVAARRKLRKTA